MTIKPIYRKIFESYNLAIQNKCEESLGSVKNFKDFENLINDARDTWEKTPFEGRLPAEYFAELEDDRVKDMFEYAAVTCDEFIPDSFVQVIMQSGFVTSLEEYAFGEADIDMKNAAIKVIGLSGNAGYTERLVGLLYSAGDYGELLQETARQAIIDIGSPAIPVLEEKLGDKDILADDDFHIVIALIGIDSNRKSENVFRILKESFKKTSDKALAARCLADYGDGRAVPMLRSYLERNLRKLDENTVFELQGAVLQLGGSTDGLNTPEKG